MKKIAFFLLLSFSLTFTVSASFQQFFLDKTMRVDYFHTGGKQTEIFSLDQVYEQGIWAGSQTNLIDTLNMGKYQTKIFDKASGELIYSRGFSSYYGEWETTAEARKIYRTFHESVLIPSPQKPVKLVIAKRGRDGLFQDVWSDCEIEPDSRFINREVVQPDLKIVEVFINGSSAVKADLLILGDGYAKGDSRKFKKDLNHFTEVLFRAQPFKKRKNDFNVRGIQALSQDSGIDEPRKNLWRRNGCGCSFNSLDLPRYVLTTSNREIRNIAANAPYDHLIILFNSERYGGGGIYNLYAIAYSGSKEKEKKWIGDYVFVHEFGHSFGGLADEYYSSNVSYEDFYPPGVEPWEPNITALLTGSPLKWRHQVADNTPIPTPWNKAKYDSLSAAKYQLDPDSKNYHQEYNQIVQAMENHLKSQKYSGQVGAFEGAGYSSKGLYRPYLDCRMFSKSLAEFDPVCQEAIERVIDFWAR